MASNRVRSGSVSSEDEHMENIICNNVIPDIMMTSYTDPKTLGTLFEENDKGESLFFDSDSNRIDNKLNYRIPFRQRYGSSKWKLPEKQLLVDTVFKSFPLQGIVVSTQYDKDINMQYNDIEDGASRLSVLQSYKKDGFKYKGKMYSELERRHQNRFDQYIVPITNISSLSNAPENIIDDAFYRLNLGRPLTDSDRYWSMQNASPLVSCVIKIMKEPFWDGKMMNTEKFGDKNRSCLPNVCSLIAPLMFGNEYTSTSSKMLEPILREPLDYELVKAEVKSFLNFYSDIIEEAEKEEKLVSNQMGWNKTSKQLGLIIRHYNDDKSAESLIEKTRLWIGIMKIARRKPNFWFGEQTIWNGLPNGVCRNMLENDIRQRLNRVKEFADMTKRAELCDREHIEWE